MKRTFTLGLGFALLTSGLLFAADKGLETGIEDDLTVKGVDGSKEDPDLEIWGYSALGTNSTQALYVTNGAGNLFVSKNVEIGSNLYLRGVGLIFPDHTTQTTAHISGLSPVSTLVSGECDTNRIDILFSTNYLVTAVKVQQTPAISQEIRVFTNSILVDSFALSAATGTRTLSFPVKAFDRLGIACTNINGTVLFTFEGQQP